MTRSNALKSLFFLAVLLGACSVRDEDGAGDWVGEADDGTALRIAVAGDEVSVEVGDEAWLLGEVVEGSFELLDASGLVVRGHVGHEVSGFLTRPDGDEVTFHLDGDEGIANQSFAATTGSSCSCIWVLGAAHYHCTVNGETRCYGSCPK